MINSIKDTTELRVGSCYVVMPSGSLVETEMVGEDINDYDFGDFSDEGDEILSTGYLFDPERKTIGVVDTTTRKMQNAKCMPNDSFDEFVGFCIAFTKSQFGGKTKIIDYIDTIKLAAGIGTSNPKVYVTEMERKLAKIKKDDKIELIKRKKREIKELQAKIEFNKKIIIEKESEGFPKIKDINGNNADIHKKTKKITKAKK